MSMTSCTYTTPDLPNSVSHQELVDHIKTTKGDTINSKSSELRSGNDKEVIIEHLKKINREVKMRRSEEKLLGEAEYSSSSTYSPQTFIDSGLFRFRNQQVLPEKREDDARDHMIKMYVADGMTEVEAKYKVDKTFKNWETINEDAFSLHSILNSFNFKNSTEDSFREFEAMLKKNKEYNKFLPVARSLFDQISGRGGVMNKMRGVHKLTDSEKATILTGLNLSGTIEKEETGILDLVGHIDNLVIDSNGNCHIYNYVVTSVPIEMWPQAKVEKYRYKMALLKQLLAHNGININNTELHLVPILLDYSEDYSKIENVAIDAQHTQLPFGNKFHKYETMAKYFLKSNFELSPITSPQKTKISEILSYFFPEKNITAQGITQSIDDWIKFNYSGKWENRIVKVDNKDYAYEVFLDDQFEQSIKIYDTDSPLQNKEIRKAVEQHLIKLKHNSNNYIYKLVTKIQSSRRAGTANFDDANNKTGQIINGFLSRSLKQYLLPTAVIDDVKYFDWELISNKTLLDAGILVFKNKEDQIDVVTLTSFNVKSMLDFKGQKNIMGNYIPDASKETSTLIHYKSNIGNIEAIRTMTILNEVLPELNLADCTLGNLKIISATQNPDIVTHSIETLNKELFQESIKIVKKNRPEFKYTNNFTKSKYIDPINLLLQEYTSLVASPTLTAYDKRELIGLNIPELESLPNKHAKIVALRALIQRIFRIDQTLESASSDSILKAAYDDPSIQRRVLAKMYIKAQEALNYYHGYAISKEEKISKLQAWGLKTLRVNNRTFQEVVSIFVKAADDIAYEVKKLYNPLHNLNMEFYKAQGYGVAHASILGDQSKAFNNLYKRNDKNQIMMQFRNPYETDSQTALNIAEREYLKKALFYFAEIRSKMYGFDFPFTVKDIDSDSYKSFITKNRGWYFNAPLKKASEATKNSQSISDRFEVSARRSKEFFTNISSYFDKYIQGYDSKREKDLTEEKFNALVVHNPFTLGDGYEGGESQRSELLHSHPNGYFETNVENLLGQYLERYVQSKEYNKALISVKGILLHLQILGNTTDGHNQGIEQTVTMITDFVKDNMFNISLMEPTEQKIVGYLTPLRKLVTKAFLAGNITSMFRDTFEGMWQHSARILTKYQTDLKAKSFIQAGKLVTKAAFTSVRNITIVDELCKIYRLSNLDVARISEGLTTSRGGINNISNWMYSTMRTPDFMNRMTLFVARCIQDGTWDAFDIKDNALVYNWKKDKRFSIYASGNTSHPEYKNQRIAYYNAVRTYNEENPDKAVEYTDDLPLPYSFGEIQKIRELANSIYGSYDKALRSKYEKHFLGLTFTMFTTWANGIVANYYTPTGVYSGGLTEQIHDTDASGNLLFMDLHGRLIVKIESEDKYFYEDSGEEVTDLDEISPVMKETPLVIQGIIQTLGYAFKRISTTKDPKGVWKELMSNEMQKKNLAKLLSDLLSALLFTALFKFFLSPLYDEYKKDGIGHSAIENALVEVLYTSSSRSYEGFFGPVALLRILGEETNPPTYQFSTNLVKQVFALPFNDKAASDLLYNNIAVLRTFKNTHKIEQEKERLLEKREQINMPKTPEQLEELREKKEKREKRKEILLQLSE